MPASQEAVAKGRAAFSPPESIANATLLTQPPWCCAEGAGFGVEGGGLSGLEARHEEQEDDSTWPRFLNLPLKETGERSLQCMLWTEGVGAGASDGRSLRLRRCVETARGRPQSGPSLVPSLVLSLVPTEPSQRVCALQGGGVVVEPLERRKAVSYWTV